MEFPGKWKARAGMVWQGLSFGLGVLLLVDFLVCLVAVVASVEWLLGQFELAVATAVLLLAGILVFLPGKRLGAGKPARQLLMAGLIGGGLVLVFFSVAYAAALFSVLDYI